MACTVSSMASSQWMRCGSCPVILLEKPFETFFQHGLPSPARSSNSDRRQRERYKLLETSRRRPNHSKQQTGVLRGWFNNNITLPYPSSSIKDELARQTSLTRKQIDAWFVNGNKGYGFSILYHCNGFIVQQESDNASDKGYQKSTALFPTFV